jgi:uncharacterized protein (DUF1684 family)
MRQAPCAALFLLFAVAGYSQEDPATVILAQREVVNKKFLENEASPLDPADKKKFTGLNYYSIDPGYRVKGKFVKTEKPSIFKMKMTASPKMEYTAVGYVTGEFQGVEFKLTAYAKPESPEVYFIPFTDATNGKDTYESGRYVDLPGKESGEVLIDFNTAYNPYCAYSRRFSCPIPPPENKLTVAIPAGEKKFHTSH